MTACEDPPSAPHLTALAGPAKVALRWTVASNHRGVRVLRRADRRPESPTDSMSTQVYDGPDSSVTDQCLTPGVTYYYGVWSYNGCTGPVFSETPDSAQASPTMPDSPLPPEPLQVQSGTRQLRLSWLVPASDCSITVVVRRSETHFPASPIEGDPVYEGELTSIVDAGLSPLTIYYYSAFSRDRFGRYSPSPAQAQGTPDWEYLDITLPAFEMYDRFPGLDCSGPFADCDVYRPRVEIAVSLKNDGNLTFWAEVTKFKVWEGANDLTCIQKFSGITDVWGTPTFTGPRGQGWILHGLVDNSGVDTLTYVDDDFPIDRIKGKAFVDYADIKAETFGDDVCGTTEDDTHLHKLVTRSLTVRLRR